MATLVLLSATLLLGLLLPSSMANNILYAGDTLYSDYSLTEGSYTFTMQDDCNLVLDESRLEVWSSNTTGQGTACHVKLYTDGNLVIYNSNDKPINWSSDTAGKEDKYILVVHRDGYVVIYEPIWTRPNKNTANSKGFVLVKRGHSDTSITAADNNILYAGDRLNTGQSLTQGSHTFIMQSDCNLVLDDGQNQALWTSATNGLGDNCFANLQTDGNLVIHNDKNEAVWSTNTAGEEDKYILFLHRDGHIIIYKPIWTRPNNDDNSTNRKIAMVTNN
ncbi:curculin-1-like [Zingiber officinale]|uniref:Bulb-type lectin domain-containing protein n=1 Tax=Zingiber officinale TaxID=94328 RepID=A0A8J5EYA0_ZINOF|nr:curculin-1-like [Zingiber officinale]KAG6476860.1 hypothetical protein ZIOFF_066108 [Zingiber officinale]